MTVMGWDPEQQLIRGTLRDTGLWMVHMTAQGREGVLGAARFGGVLCYQEGQLGVWLNVSAC